MRDTAGMMIHHQTTAQNFAFSPKKPPSPRDRLTPGSWSTSWRRGQPGPRETGGGQWRVPSRHLLKSRARDLRQTATHFVQDILEVGQAHLAQHHQALPAVDRADVARVGVEEVDRVIVQFRQRTREAPQLGKKDLAIRGGIRYRCHGILLCEGGFRVAGEFSWKKRLPAISFTKYIPTDLYTQPICTHQLCFSRPLAILCAGGARMNDETLGQRIRRLREGQGLSQAALARRLEASTNAINLLEQDRISNPHWQRLVALADIVGVSLDYLAGRTDDPTPPQKRPRPRKAASVG